MSDSAPIERELVERANGNGRADPAPDELAGEQHNGQPLPNNGDGPHWTPDDPEYLEQIREAELVDKLTSTAADPQYRAAVYGGGETRAVRRTGDVDGAAFALDEPATVAAVWGSGTAVLWPEGEPTMLYGPDGVGKTTVAQQLVCRLVGIGAPELLGHPVAVREGKVLYLALDRPKQAARSLRRMVSEGDRATLRNRLAVWRGSPPFDVVSDPGSLAKFALERGAGIVFIDSLKDLVPKLSDEDTGTALHRAFQTCIEQGVEVFPLHHPRKAQADNKKPRALADVYGSRWLTAGMGSVLLLWGDAGDPIVKLEHLKQPADVVGPLTLLHDSRAGATTVLDSSDVVGTVEAKGGSATVAEVAAALFRKDPDATQIEKARRRLNGEIETGRLEKAPTKAGEPAIYHVTEQGSREGSRGVTERVTPDGHAAPHVVGARDPGHDSRALTVPDADAELDRLHEKFPELDEKSSA